MTPINHLYPDMPDTNLLPWEEEYFATRIKEAITDNERIFFETLRHRHNHHWYIVDDRLVEETSNKERIYLWRLLGNEYEIDHQREDGTWDTEYHVMDIKEVMEINLKDVGYIKENLTVLDWLRKNDFSFVNYNNLDE